MARAKRRWPAGHVNRVIRPNIWLQATSCTVKKPLPTGNPPHMGTRRTLGLWDPPAALDRQADFVKWILEVSVVP
jgi:hypothetical protein